MDSTPATLEVVSEPASAIKIPCQAKRHARRRRSYYHEPVDWETAKASYFSGSTMQQVADSQRVSIAIIGERASKEGWVHTLKQRVQDAELERSKLFAVSPSEAALEIAGSERAIHRKNVAKILNSAMSYLLKENELGERANIPKIHDWKDVETVVKLDRTNLGMDAEGKNPSQTLVNVNLLSVGDLPAITISKS